MMQSVIQPPALIDVVVRVLFFCSFLNVLPVVCFPEPVILYGQDGGDSGNDGSRETSHRDAGEFAMARQAAERAENPSDASTRRMNQHQRLSLETFSTGSSLGSNDAYLPSAPSGQFDADLMDQASGGGSFADFQMLIDLIQTTVVPDTWESLGGPSTMASYPQGVYVDASGTIIDCQPLSATHVSIRKEAEPKRNSARGKSGSNAWKDPSRLRFVSLGRLSSRWNRWQQQGLTPSEAMRNLAGLSSIQHIFLEPNDIVIAGTVGGIDQTDGWYQDRESGKSTLSLDFLRANLWSAFFQQPYGCTIDPTREGLQRAAEVGQRIQQQQIPIQEASGALTEALGMQRVEVFGIPGDLPIGYVMVEADRHMKKLALGQHPMPLSAMNYLDAIDQAIAQGPPQELLLRLWFTAEARQLRANQEKTYFQLSGTPIRLSSENERALLSGKRGAITQDPRTKAFVQSFNQNWVSIRQDYPIYGALESIYEAASLAEVIKRFGDSPAHARIVEILTNGATESPALLKTPRQVASIGTMHSVRHGSKRHHVLLASGGVSVDSGQTLPEQLVQYPLIQTQVDHQSARPLLQQRWWWNSESDAKQP